MNRYNIRLNTYLAFICFALVAGAVLAGCSSSGAGGIGGYGTGPGGISDHDLALGGADYGDGNIPVAKADGFFRDVHFPFDSSVISAEDRERLRVDAQHLTADPTIHAEIEGHCDKRGTTEYNLALGEERAKAVAQLLVSYGVRPEQLSTISYGAEIPLDPRDTEEAYAKNRRAHFTLYRRR